MAATGYFTDPRTALLSSRVIYQKPATSPIATQPSFPVARLPVTSSPATSPLTVPTAVYPVNVDPTGGSVGTVSTFGGTTTSGGTATGFTPSQPLQQPIITESVPQTTGTTPSDPGAGSTGGNSDTSRLLDLLAGAFKPQDIQQGYAPQAVSSDAIGSGGGTNPMAILVLAIMAIIGVVWWTHRKGRA